MRHLSHLICDKCHSLRIAAMPKEMMDRLTRREREIVNALFALDNRASAEEIRARLANPPSDSSVRVMLKRLEKKGYLKHQQDRVRYLYSVTVSRAAAKRCRRSRTPARWSKRSACRRWCGPALPWAAAARPSPTTGTSSTISGSWCVMGVDLRWHAPGVAVGASTGAHGVARS